MSLRSYERRCFYKPTALFSSYYLYSILCTYIYYLINFRRFDKKLQKLLLTDHRVLLIWLDPLVSWSLFLILLIKDLDIYIWINSSKHFTCPRYLWFLVNPSPIKCSLISSILILSTLNLSQYEYNYEANYIKFIFFLILFARLLPPAPPKSKEC